MFFTDQPLYVAPEVYDEAVETYVERVKHRARAVYQVGSRVIPGISDIDLLVIPDAARLDNAQYYSFRVRLPKRLQRPFRHQPHFLPPECLGVLRYTGHYQPKLLAGEDLLPVKHADPYPPDLGLELSWARVIEDYCSYEHIYRTARTSGQISARVLLSKVKSIMLPLNGLQRLNGERSPLAGLTFVHELRENWFKEDRGDDALEEAWRIFCRRFEQLRSELQIALELRENSSITGYAAEFLAGNHPTPHLGSIDPSVLRERSKNVRHYLETLSQYHLGYGSLFTRTIDRPFVSTVPREHAPPFLIRGAISLAYRALGRYLPYRT